ncbi:hypothetical protein KAU08_09185, partial [bacterium]|nr:hypothetical protein [bacterium]
NEQGIPLKGTATISPSRGLDMGYGRGKAVKGEIYGGMVGIVLDARGRQLKFHPDAQERVKQPERWSKAFDAYPERKGGT